MVRTLAAGMSEQYHRRRSLLAHLHEEPSFFRQHRFLTLPTLCFYFPSTCPHCFNYSWWQDIDDDGDPCSCYPSRDFDPCVHCYFCDWVFADTHELYDQSPPWVTTRVKDQIVRVYREILLDCNCCFHGVEDARFAKLA
jgi:hypothetical protein